MKPLSQLVRPNIQALQPYSTARDEYAGGGIDAWLDANESPYDNGVNRYPDPHQRALKALIAELKDVDAGRIFIGNGSDEAIDLAFRIFCRPGLDNAVSIAPTYGMYRVAAATNDVQMREVPLGAGYSLPVGALLAAAVLLVLACRGYDWDALGRYKGDNISSLHYVRGRVVEVLRDDTKPDQLDPARSMGTQELRILLLEGANKGTEVTIANYLTRTQNVRLRQGETAIICEDLPDSADAYYTVYNYDRAPVLVLILAVFAAAVVAIGGWKGVRTLLGLGFTGAMIAWLILPGIYHGLPSLPLTVAALAVCTLVSLLLLNPPSPKTWAAMLSTLAGVALAGGVFYLFSTLLHLSGMNDTNGEGLVLVAGQTGLELHWLLLVAVLISSLGAVMDVALSLASSLHELREADGKMSGLQLFAAGMRIGRDMIGTMSNTLILAFAGEAVTTLLLLMAYGWHSSQLFASDYAAIQVAQGVASTLGVVLGVPITSGICAALYRPLKR